MNTDLPSVHDTLYELWDELTMVRVTAQLLLRRLEGEPGDMTSKREACQIIIDQTRVIEQALERVVVEPTPLDARFAVDSIPLHSPITRSAAMPDIGRRPSGSYRPISWISWQILSLAGVASCMD